jgi:hypothetical protein
MQIFLQAYLLKSNLFAFASSRWEKGMIQRLSSEVEDEDGPVQGCDSNPHTVRSGLYDTTTLTVE